LNAITWGTDFEGHVFAVGGAVRDLQMDNSIKDIDIVVDLPNGGIRLAQYLYDYSFLTHEPVKFPTYGTVKFNLAAFPDDEIEAVQTRKEQYHDRSSRNPETAYGSLEEDCMRRDLTINALYYDIKQECFADPTGKGIDDIKNHRIRVTSTPDIVFDDDPLRILRVVRFSSRFGWDIDDDTFYGMKKHTNRLEIISKERIADELNKMLVCDHPVEAMKVLREISAWKYIIPEMEETFDMEQNQYHNMTVWEHTLAVLGNLDRQTIVGQVGTYDGDIERVLLVRMAALLHDIGKIRTRTVGEDGRVHFIQHENVGAQMCDEILRNLKYSVEFIQKVQHLVKNHMRCKAWGNNLQHMKKKSLRKLQYEIGVHNFDTFLMLIDADNKAHAPEHCMPNQAYNIASESDMLMYEGDDMFMYKLPVNGDDIMRTKNIKPGRAVRKYLDYLLKLAYNNPKLTREEMLDKIKNLKEENI